MKLRGIFLAINYPRVDATEILDRGFNDCCGDHITAATQRLLA